MVARLLDTCFKFQCPAFSSSSSFCSWMKKILPENNLVEKYLTNCQICGSVKSWVEIWSIFIWWNCKIKQAFFFHFIYSYGWCPEVKLEDVMWKYISNMAFSQHFLSLNKDQDKTCIIFQGNAVFFWVCACACFVEEFSWIFMLSKILYRYKAWKTA